MKSLTLIIGFFLIVKINAQGTIMGKVTDEKGKAITSVRCIS